MSIWFAAWTIPAICGSVGACANALRFAPPKSPADVTTAAKQVLLIFNLFSPSRRIYGTLCVLAAQGPHIKELRPAERLQSYVKVRGIYVWDWVLVGSA